MIGKKINQLATELAPVSTDLTIIGDPTTGVSKKITLAQLGAIFSGAVSFYSNLAGFPATGDINVIYCAKDTQKLYLWSGSAYVEVFPSQALLDTYQLRSEKGNANGYASLDSQGKVPISQLPSSIMEYKGTWSAATNTPTLANGTGDTGDVYICNAAGSVNFGAGAISFAVGDYVIYSGTIWQRSSGAVGTVTSVALTVGGDAISVSGSPLTTSGTLALAFSGTTSQYIRGNGTLANFPTSLVTGTGTINSVTKWSFTSGEIINSNIYDTGSVIYNNNPSDGQFAWQFNGSQTTGLSYGALIVAGTNASDIALRIQNASSTSEYFFVWGDGRVQINNIPNATTDTDKFLVSDSGVIKYRTGAELLSDIGGASATGYVPYTGATANVDLGTHTLLAKNLVINHSSGSGVAASITKGGSGEALTVVKSSGSGNAASITGGVTLLSELHLTTDLADAYIASATNWNTAYSLRITSATSPLSITSNVISIAQASGSTNGYLSSTDWTTFNNKQNALTNPVTGSGTTNYLPKFTGASTIGDSAIFDNSGNILIGATTNSEGAKLKIAGGYVYLKETGGADVYLRSAYDTNKAAIQVASASDLVFVTSNTTRLTLTASGNLGLGVTPSDTLSYGKALDIQGTSGSALYVRSETNSSTVYGLFSYDNNTVRTNIGGIGTGNYLRFISGGSEAMRLNASGNLSIGNTNDTYKLDVTGTGRFVNASTFQGIFSGWSTSGANSASGAISLGNTAAYRGVISYAADGDTTLSFDNSYDSTGAVMRFRMRTAGTAVNALTIAGTGAATFSSSVTATSGTFSQSSGITTIIQSDWDRSATNNTQLYIRGNTNTNKQLRIGYDTAGNVGYIQALTSGTGVDNLLINPSGGNVGIGTSSPQRPLHINGTEGAARFTSTASGNDGFEVGVGTSSQAFLWHTENAEMQFATNNTERMRITSGGDIGIGNTGDASVRLFVSGKDTSSNNYAALFRNSSGSNLLGVKNSGRINMGSLPTSSAGLSSGDLYVAAGVLMIV